MIIWNDAAKTWLIKPDASESVLTSEKWEQATGGFSSIRKLLQKSPGSTWRCSDNYILFFDNYADAVTVENAYYDAVQSQLQSSLKEFQHQPRGWSTPAVSLFKAGYLEADGLYALKITLLGRMALRGIFVGRKFRITESHHLSGRKGIPSNARSLSFVSRLMFLMQKVILTSLGPHGAFTGQKT